METRATPRLNINLKIISEVDEECQQKFKLVCGKRFESEIFNISEIGIGLFSNYFLPQGLILELEIDGTPFGLKETMKIKGEVRHCKYTSIVKTFRYSCGVKFLNMSNTYRKAIGQFIYAHERRKEPRVQLTD